MDTETGLQKVGFLYCWADRACIPYLFISLSSLVMIWTTTKMSRCSLPHCSLCMYVCVLFCLLGDLVCRFPVFSLFLESSGNCGYVRVCSLSMMLSVFSSPCLSQTPVRNNTLLYKGQHQSHSQARFLNKSCIGRSLSLIKNSSNG